MAEQNRSDLLAEIKAGKVVYVNGRSAATPAELDFALGADADSHPVPDVGYIDHGSNVIEIQVTGSLEPGAIPGSDPNVVARMSPEGTSATTLNQSDLPGDQKPEGGQNREQDLSRLTREELNAHAASLGVADPHLLPNKPAVLEAIAAAGAPGAGGTGGGE